ncbi:MAG: hypothetical protein K0S91_718 [Nitrososphaeraceae archaeon]|jgi:hypothetical protein|nr:hypothetical protein [Nitrososphaeraceae archaeon]
MDSRSYITSGNSFSGDEIKAERDTNIIVDYTFKPYMIYFIIIFQTRLAWRAKKPQLLSLEYFTYSMINIEYITIIVNTDSRMKNGE